MSDSTSTAITLRGFRRHISLRWRTCKRVVAWKHGPKNRTRSVDLGLFRIAECEIHKWDRETCDRSRRRVGKRGEDDWSVKTTRNGDGDDGDSHQMADAHGICCRTFPDRPRPNAWISRRSKGGWKTNAFARLQVGLVRNRSPPILPYVRFDESFEASCKAPRPSETTSFDSTGQKSSHTPPIMPFFS